MDEEEFIKQYPEEIQSEIREDLENIAEENEKLIEEFSEDTDNTDKRGVGRPVGTPASSTQKEAVSKAAKKYQQDLRDGLIEKPAWETHGAFSYMKDGRVPKKKRYLLDFVHEEREKWLEELGGEENLGSIEKAMLDEACRLLLFSTMVNDYLLSEKDTDIVYKGEDGDIKMHTGLSRHYLSFTKTYISILKELQKVTTKKGGNKKGGSKKDSASLLQKLYKGE